MHMHTSVRVHVHVHAHVRVHVQMPMLLAQDFVANLKLFLPARPISHLICNAAVYLPAGSFCAHACVCSCKPSINRTRAHIMYACVRII